MRLSAFELTCLLAQLLTARDHIALRLNCHDQVAKLLTDRAAFACDVRLVRNAVNPLSKCCELLSLLFKFRLFGFDRVR